MATETRGQILNQAISDFDNIEAAIEECGVDVPYGTDTSEYGNKVREVYLMAIENAKSVFNADTHYNFPSVGSEDIIYKAQTEKKIYQWNPKELQYEELVSTDALPMPIQFIENTNSENKVPLRSLESGTYILKGYFTSYEGGTHSYTFSTGMLVAVVKTDTMTYVQIFYPKNNTIQYVEISDTDVTRKDAKLVNMETVANMVTVIDETSDDTHYPSAKAVYDAIEALRAELQSGT